VRIAKILLMRFAFGVAMGGRVLTKLQPLIRTILDSNPSIALTTDALSIKRFSTWAQIAQGTESLPMLATFLDNFVV
jgi:hypothetical protein